MTKKNYSIYKQAAGMAPESKLSLLAVIRKLLSKKKQEQAPEPTPQNQLPPLPADAWHAGGIGM